MRTCEIAASLSLSSLFSGTVDPCHDRGTMRWDGGWENRAMGAWGMGQHGGVAKDQSTAEVGLGGARLDRGGWQARPWCGLGCFGQGNLRSRTRVRMGGVAHVLEQYWDRILLRRQSVPTS